MVKNIITPLESLDNRQTIVDTLNLHNKLRALHAVPKLSVKQELNNLAQGHAEYLARRNIFEHSSNKEFQGTPLGENIAMQWSTDKKEYKGEVATQGWYDEIKLYDFKSKKPNSGTGHFTQLVWKNTKEIGIGRAKSQDGCKWYVVANYFPAGNYVGEYEKNVMRK